MEIALGNSKDKLKKKSAELEKKIENWEKEKKKLVEDLKAEYKATENEPGSSKSLETQAQLVEKIEAFQLNCLDMGNAGFSITVNQLRILNSNLNTEGASLSSKIVDGRLIIVESEENKKEEEEKDG